uniref:Vacuolar protein sorting-associated protein 54 n=1 Tax=Amphilophus citrinellus TaxID=61819 RepID=A0A3Q0RWH7_AMPCI
MASSHSSSPVPRPSSGGRDGVYHKEQALSPPHCRTICSLPDVCPKEPTGEGRGLCNGPSVVAEHDRWTVYSSKVNLPAALNDPRLAKRESDFFTKTWGLDFTETEVMPSFCLPNITKEHFGPYLQEMAQRERIHERCKMICPNKDDVDAVSSIFMKPDFALEDPATFNMVLPWSHFNSAGGKSSRDVASSKLLQEKLSHYLDVVEVSIARQISLRSEAFFHAMSSQHELQDQLQETQQAVAVLRGRTVAMDRVMCQGPLQALRTALTRNNCVKLHNKLKLMAAVHQTQPTVQLLLSTSEFVGALELIATTKEVLQQELQGIHSFRHLGSQLCELEKLIDKMMVEDFSMYTRSDLNRSLRDEPQVLEKERLESLVFGLLRQRKLDFLDIYSDEMIIAAKAIVSQCVADSVVQIEEIDTEVIVKLADQMRLMTFPQWFELLKNVFESFLFFLQRIKATMNVIRNVVLEVLDANQKNQLLNDSCSERSGPEASQVPSLLQGEAELAYLTHEGLFITDALNEAQQLAAQDQSSAAGFRSQQGQVETASSDPGNTEMSATEISSGSSVDASVVSLIRNGLVSVFVFRPSENMMPADFELNLVISSIQELMYTASDISHDRCVKVLTARAKDGSLERLSSAEFVCLSQAVEGFARDTEELCGRRSVSLRGALQSQANRFVHRFHEERKTKLSLLLDNERWKQAEVPAEFQNLVNSIADGRISLPERKTPGPDDRKPTEFLLVNGQKYAVVGTVLLLIRIFLEYCQCVNDIPSIATDMLTRLSDLFKHFNSRSCQLVLGAGALQVVGLKTITTKNLALASRCLQLVVHYIPIIRAHFETKLQPKQFSVLRHFDHITKDYNDHIAEISAKLVAIMDSLFEKVLSKYEVKAPMPSTCFRNICKQMAKMHEAIYDLLPEEQTQMLFLRINASFKMHLKRQLARLGVINDGGPQHGLVVVDVAFYTENIQGLKSLERLDLNMAEVWEQKR